LRRAAVGEVHRQAGLPAFDRRGQTEADQHGAVPVGLKAVGTVERPALVVVELVIDVHGDIDGTVGQRPTLGATGDDAGLYLIARSVAGAVEVELLVEARLLIAVDGELAGHRGEAARLLGHGEGVLAAGRDVGVGFEIALAATDALDRLAVGAVDDTGLRG